MKWRRLVAGPAISLACLGILIPPPLAHAAAEAAPAVSTGGVNLAGGDVALAAGGVLRGQVVDVHGSPVQQAPVSVRHVLGEVRATVTDGSGRFEIAGLRGGTYQIVAGSSAGVFRLWAPQTAPPSAQPAALIVVAGPQVLGQQGPLASWCCAHPLIIAGLIAAAIAIPIAIHNHQIDRDREPVSPP